MAKLIVSDIPVSGKFMVKDASGTILHMYDGIGPGDIAPDIAVREVAGVSTENGIVCIKVADTADEERKTYLNYQHKNDMELICARISERVMNEEDGEDDEDVSIGGEHFTAKQVREYLTALLESESSISGMAEELRETIDEHIGIAEIVNNLVDEIVESWIY